MNEVKTPKKPLIYYYAIMLLILLLFNFLAMPWIAQRQIQEVDYGTFMQMARDKEIGQVEVQKTENQILFTDKDETAIYKTGMMPDPDLTQRLFDSGAKFSGEIIQQTDPLLSVLLNWVLPIVVFVALGQYLSKRMMNKMGGPNSMMFGMGKSNAKVYVKSSEGIKFSDVAGEDEAKESLQEVVDYLHDPGKYREIGASMPKGILLVGPPGTGKTMLANYLYQKETITGEEFMDILNRKASKGQKAGTPWPMGCLLFGHQGPCRPHYRESKRWELYEKRRCFNGFYILPCFIPQIQV